MSTMSDQRLLIILRPARAPCNEFQLESRETAPRDQLRTDPPGTVKIMCRDTDEEWRMSLMLGWRAGLLLVPVFLAVGLDAAPPDTRLVEAMARQDSQTA